MRLCLFVSDVNPFKKNPKKTLQTLKFTFFKSPVTVLMAVSAKEL